MMCICEWPVGCGGIGAIFCEGCGGDICVCLCGGEMACPGCDECSLDCDYGDPDLEDLDDSPPQSSAGGDDLDKASTPGPT